MEITPSNISAAIESANQHESYAVQLGLMGRKREAAKHAKHAKSIMAEVFRLTAPAVEVGNDELFAELMGEYPKPESRLVFWGGEL